MPLSTEYVASFQQDLGRYWRYQVSARGSQLTFGEVLLLWQSSAPFRSWFTDLLASSPFEAFRWETPPISRANVNQPFEFVLFDAPGFISRKTDNATFREYFCLDSTAPGIVTFPSLGKDSTLIVPSPRTDRDVYGHLASFLRGAPPVQTDELWRVVGETIAAKLDRARWLSTAGGGVAWLHVRIDSSPKYYQYAPYRTALR